MRTFYFTYQAQKRKLGLLEDDDTSKLAEEGQGTDEGVGYVKNRGMFVIIFGNSADI